MDCLFTVALKQAIKEGNVDVVSQALTGDTGGCMIETADISGMTLLMYAVVNGQTEIVNLLVEYGANVNARQKNGTTILMHACEQVSGDFSCQVLFLRDSYHVLTS